MLPASPGRPSREPINIFNPKTSIFIEYKFLEYVHYNSDFDNSS